MKLAVLLLVVLTLGVFCCAELGDEWDSFEVGDGSESSSVEEVDIGVGGSGDEVVVSQDNLESYDGRDSLLDSEGYSSGTEYTSEFYIALGVGAFGFIIVAIFVYFFLKKPKNRWKKRKALK